MKKYRNDNAEFSEVIDIFEPTDPVDADSVDNVPLKQLHDNDLVLRDGINNSYNFVDQVLAAAFLNYQRISRLTTFDYDPSSETILNAIGSAVNGETVTFFADSAQYSEDETIELMIGADYPFGVDGFIYNNSNERIISPAGSRVVGETYVINDSEALYDGSGTIILPSGTTGLSALSSTSDINHIATLAAGIVEANVEYPSNEDIDNLFS